LEAPQSPFGDGMEIVHAHIATKLNPPTMDFQHKTKAGNLMHHKEPSPPKKLIVKHLICGKIAKKVWDLKNRNNFPFL